MVKKTAREATDKWKKNLRGATKEMEDGARRVTEAPSKLAIAQKAKCLTKIIKAFEDGTWETELAKYGLADWQKDFIETGIPRVSGGVEKADAKMEAFMSWLIPKVDSAQKVIAGMPSVTLEDNLARCDKYLREMAKAKYKGK